MLRNLLQRLTRSGPYTFGATPIDRGYGAQNQAFGRPYAPLASGQYGPRYNVQRTLAPFPMAGDLVVAQSLPKVDLKAGGVYFGGDFGLTALSENPGNNQ